MLSAKAAAQRIQEALDAKACCADVARKAVGVEGEVVSN
jgi:hypothetical protein